MLKSTFIYKNKKKKDWRNKRGSNLVQMVIKVALHPLD